MALVIYAITLFVSAFLLFLVQPLIGKMILPKLGGTPQVWNTCMMFFQMMLLAGYFYTHYASTRLNLRRQITVHAALLCLPLIFLFGYMLVGNARYPFDIQNWAPTGGRNPIPEALLLLFTTVGIPFFVVSTSAPLLQKWFAHSDDPSARDPYFLSIASNVGSLSSLLLYPVLIEPFMTLQEQSWTWAVGFLALAAILLYAASLVWNAKPLAIEPAVSQPVDAPPITPAQASTAIQSASSKTGFKPGKGKAQKLTVTASTPATVGGGDVMTLWRRLRWIALAAVPSSLMLGVTSYISTDLSPFPLVWIIPLALYLLSFILVFMKSPINWLDTPHRVCTFLSIIGVLAMSSIYLSKVWDPTRAMPMLFLGFFAVALASHGELARDRPSPKHLTEFFLMMSVGGLIGGVFNGLLAPVIFRDIYEFPIALIAACFFHPALNLIGWTEQLITDNAPDLRKKLVDQGNRMAAAVGLPPPNRPVALSLALDVFFALLTGLVAWLLLTQMPSSLIITLTNMFTSGGADAAQRIRQLLVMLPPFLMAACMSGRPIRYGLAMAAIFVVNLSLSSSESRRESQTLLWSGRTYFGVLKVYEDRNNSWSKNTYAADKYGKYERNPKTKELTEIAERFEETTELLGKSVTAPSGEEHVLTTSSMSKFFPRIAANQLLHGSTHHGLNFQIPELARLATTYYHRYGPVGYVMEPYNWFTGKQNTYHSDARVAASLIANLGAMTTFPMESITPTQTEPPIAIIGLGTGTMASYGRPFGHVTYYEIDDKIRDLSLPPDGKEKERYFKYLDHAQKRGCNVEVIMGDARQAMSARQEKQRIEARDAEIKEKKTTNSMPQGRDGYYKVIVVDAFSSDAIPVHLITEEAIKMYMSKLAPDGVLCVHTSNRHLTLINPVADIAKKNGYEWLTGRDAGNGQEGLSPGSLSMGHFVSEYIMVVHPKSVVPDYKVPPKSADSDRSWGDRRWGGWILQVLNDEKLNKENPRIRLFPFHPTEVRMANAVADGKNAIGVVLRWYKNRAPGNRVWTDDFSNILQIYGRESADTEPGGIGN